jgi:hypothetical protein
MPRFRRSVLLSALGCLCAAAACAQRVQPLDGTVAAGAGDSLSHSSLIALAPEGGGVQVTAPSVTGGWFLRRYAIGTFGSTLGFGARFAVSLTGNVNFRAGASYFSYSTDRTKDDIPYTANVRLQSEQAVVDWYPFHGTFHITPGVQFGNHNRVFGGAEITAGNSFTINGVNYYSSSSIPVQASGLVALRRTSPMLTVGWGNWIRHFGEKRGERHFIFPFEAGVVFSGDPVTALNYSGVVCTDSGQHNCMNIATDPEVQKNIQAERVKLQNDADWARFYPVIAGGIVYRF